MARRLLSVMCLVIGTLSLTACASSRMADLAQPPLAISAPAADKATVVFLRPAMFGGAVQSSLFDISDGRDDFIGILSAGKKIAYQTNPGAHRFMVIAESAEFLDSELKGGKLYYARVDPHMGLWKARFSLTPFTSMTSDLSGGLAECQWVENTDASRAWAREHLVQVREKQASYMPDWENSTDKAFLPASAGQ